VCAGPSSNLFTIKLHHGGDFKTVGSKCIYTGGKYTYIDYCEFDKISLVESSNMAAEVGYSGHCIFL